MKKHEQNLWEKLYLILYNGKKTTPQYLIAEEIIFLFNNGKSLNISDIAKHTFTSKPTITRFAQSFGFFGFKDFVSELYNEDTFYYYPTNITSSSESYDNYISNVKNLFINIDNQKLEIIRIAELIKHHKRIFIFSSPENNVIANTFAEKLHYIGIEVYNSLSNKHTFLLNNVSKDDLIIFLVSGYDNLTLVQIWNYVNALCKTVLISSLSQLEKFLNPNIVVSLETKPAVLYDQIKTTLFMYVLDQVFNVLVSTDKKYIDILTIPHYRI